MKASDFAWVLGGVLLNAVAQLLLKSAANSSGPTGLDAGFVRAARVWATHPGLIAGLVCYAVSVVLWLVALSRVDVSIAYPMLSIGYVVNALLAWWLFGEAVDLQRWIGIGVIVLGVALVARSGASS